MVYGAEAVLPSDIRHDSPRVANYVEAYNEQARQEALDLLDEKRDMALARSAVYQQYLQRYHSRQVKTRAFQEGDLVLRLIQDQTDMHKLSPPWEGPFVVSKNLNNGSYYLINVRGHKDSRTSEEETRRPWNIAHLRPYYTRATGSPDVHILTMYIIINIIKPASLIIQGLCHFISENMSLYCHSIRSLGGFLLIEHSYDYPLDQACTP